jgi:hypothetical protein
MCIVSKMTQSTCAVPRLRKTKLLKHVATARNSTTMQDNLSEERQIDAENVAQPYPTALYIHHCKITTILQSTTNISKRNSTNKQHTSNPSSHTHTLKRKSSQHEILPFDRTCRCIGRSRERVDVGWVGRRYQVWVDGE